MKLPAPVQANVIVISLHEQYCPVELLYNSYDIFPGDISGKITKMKHNPILRHCLIPIRYHGFIHFLDAAEKGTMRESLVTEEVCIGREEDLI